jgi:hypothetical protein
MTDSAPLLVPVVIETQTTDLVSSVQILGKKVDGLNATISYSTAQIIAAQQGSGEGGMGDEIIGQVVAATVAAMLGGRGQGSKTPTARPAQTKSNPQYRPQAQRTKYPSNVEANNMAPAEKEIPGATVEYQPDSAFASHPDDKSVSLENSFVNSGVGE